MNPQLYQELTELANKLYMYTDTREWQKLLDNVFDTTVMFDMSSAGGGPAEKIPAEKICEMWKEGFKELDSVHHQAGHYLISASEKGADIYSYAVAIHYKNSAVNGNTRTFAGSYDLKAQPTVNGWRLTQFKYNLKFIYGNMSLD